MDARIPLQACVCQRAEGWSGLGEQGGGQDSRNKGRVPECVSELSLPVACARARLVQEDELLDIVPHSTHVGDVLLSLLFAAFVRNFGKLLPSVAQALQQVPHGTFRHLAADHGRDEESELVQVYVHIFLSVDIVSDHGLLVHAPTKVSAPMHEGFDCPPIFPATHPSSDGTD